MDYLFHFNWIIWNALSTCAKEFQVIIATPHIVDFSKYLNLFRYQIRQSGKSHVHSDQLLYEFFHWALIWCVTPATPAVCNKNLITIFVMQTVWWYGTVCAPSTVGILLLFRIEAAANKMRQMNFLKRSDRIDNQAKVHNILIYVSGPLIWAHSSCVQSIFEILLMTRCYTRYWYTITYYLYMQKTHGQIETKDSPLDFNRMLILITIESIRKSVPISYQNIQKQNKTTLIHEQFWAI